jgi:hypothetical protein
MRALEICSKPFVCEVCGYCGTNPSTTGIESGTDMTSLIQLCHGCGPIDLDLMQLCREISIGCTDN